MIVVKSHSLRSKTMTEEQNEKDCTNCTDCLYFGSCYLRGRRENKEDLTPCKDIIIISKE